MSKSSDLSQYLNPSGQINVKSIYLDNQWTTLHVLIYQRNPNLQTFISFKLAKE